MHNSHLPIISGACVILSVVLICWLGLPWFATVTDLVWSVGGLGCVQLWTDGPHVHRPKIVQLMFISNLQ